MPEVEGSRAYQYVMNTNHGAWTKFTGWNAVCFENYDDGLYFGGVNVVCRADYGESDNGANITAVCQQAYSDFGANGVQKIFKMARPVFLSDGTITPAIMLNTDYQQNRTATAGSFVSGGGDSLWDVGDWDDMDWASGMTVTQRWQSVTGLGYAGSIRVVIAAKGIQCSWQSTDFIFETGSVF